MNISDLIHLPVRTDRHGIYIYDRFGVVLFNTRGYGFFKGRVGESHAAEMQKKLADFIVEKINGAPSSLGEIRAAFHEFGKREKLPETVVERIETDFFKKLDT